MFNYKNLGKVGLLWLLFVTITAGVVIIFHIGFLVALFLGVFAGVSSVIIGTRIWDCFE